MIPWRELRPTGDELREMLRLAAPVVLAQVGIMLMGVVDTAMVGRVSPETIAAVALGHIYWVNLTLPGLGLLMVLDPVVSQAVGANDRAAAARGVQRGIILAIALTIPTSLALVPGEWFFGALRQPPGVIPIAATFSRWSILGVLPFFLFIVARQSLQAMNRVAPVVIAILAANLLNVGLNWVLIYGHLGAPPLGAVGSAISTVISRWAMFALVAALGWPTLRAAVRPWDPESFSWVPIRRMVVLGAPVAFAQWLEVAVFALGAVAIGWFGTIPLAGHEIAINLASMTFMIPLGVAAAASAMVGRAIGRGDVAAARRDSVAALSVGLGVMSIAGALFLLFPRQIAGLFSSDAATVAMAASLLPLAGWFQIFDGVQGVAIGILRGSGDTKVPMLLHLGGFWGIGIPLSLGLAFWADLGPRGIWWGYVGSLMVVAALQLTRVRWRMGQDVQRIRIEDTGEWHA
jgi:MATE family multidrug resistance protein